MKIGLLLRVLAGPKSPPLEEGCPSNQGTLESEGGEVAHSLTGDFGQEGFERSFVGFLDVVPGQHQRAERDQIEHERGQAHMFPMKPWPKRDRRRSRQQKKEQDLRY